MAILTRTDAMEMLVEMVRPQVSRIAGFPVGMSELHGMRGFVETPSVVLSTPLFGGVYRFVPLNIPLDWSNGKQIEDDMLSQIKDGIEAMVQEAELRALVDYRWPGAA